MNNDEKTENVEDHHETEETKENHNNDHLIYLPSHPKVNFL